MTKTKKLSFLTLFLLTLSFASYQITTAKITKSQNQKEISVKKTTTVQKASWFSLKDTLSTDSSFIWILLIAFLTGILASLTPCIYPMIPITIGVLQSQASASVWRNLLTASSYVLGIATIYSVLGYLAATTTMMFGQWLSNPYLIFLFILLFLYFAFSMFGFYEIYIPKFLKSGKTVSPHGSIIYSFVFGLISGTVASPCLTPALALLLGFVAKLANPFLGLITLFSFSLGMGILLILIGTFSTSAITPKAGVWMIEIKKIFGFALLAVCVYFLQSFFTPFIISGLYILVALSAAVYFFMNKPKTTFKMILGAISSVITLYLLINLFL
ncbi:MAG: cytochrome c biogenesis protein CcdA [bacterium]